MNIYKKKIYKINYISDIFERYKKFYKNSKTSKYYIFPKPIKVEGNYILLENINFNSYINFYNLIHDKRKVNLLVKSIVEFYKDNNSDLEGNINLHGDLHFGNIFYGEGKILFIDPETPNWADFNKFSYNTIYFELSYLIFYLDNEKSLLSTGFYKLNLDFKIDFIKSLNQNLDKNVFENICLGYRSHIKKGFIFSCNPIFLLNRVLRFIIIYLKYNLWKSKLKKLLKV